jgi:hypothetical protein
MSAITTTPFILPISTDTINKGITCMSCALYLAGDCKEQATIKQLVIMP